jgi:prepilin-type N-terminal cleavage/methylation domain-containing protein
MKNLQKGFSLIELLVVVAIIGILAAIGSVGYSKYIASAKSGASAANADLLVRGVTAEDTTTTTLCGGSSWVGASACATAVAGDAKITFDDATPCTVNGGVRTPAFDSGTKTLTVTDCDGNAHSATLTHDAP